MNGRKRKCRLDQKRYILPTILADRMKLTRCLALALLLCSANIDALAQTTPSRNPKPVSSSTVTGRVFFADTRTPARKARVYLQPVAVLEADAPPNRTFAADAAPVTASVEAQFDGSFSFSHVSPASYYVIAICPGYMSPLIQLLLAESRSRYQEWKPLGPEQKKNRDAVLRSIARVEVQNNLAASADVMLERGAAVSGTITYDDGSPAAGLKIKLLSRMDQSGKQVWSTVELNSSFFGLTDQSITDDRGSYRICGIPPGNYAVEVQLEFSGVKEYDSPSGGSTFSSNERTALLNIYSGSTPHIKDVADFTLQHREERTGEDIMIPISKLHTVKGNIVSARDGHVINSGNVFLTNTLDHSLSANQTLTEEDASFTFSFILEGDYSLTAPMSFDVDFVPLPHIGSSPGPLQYDIHARHMYGSASMPLHVDGDIDGLTIAVPEPTPKEKQFYEDAVRQQQQRDTAPQ